MDLHIFYYDYRFTTIFKTVSEFIMHARFEIKRTILSCLNKPSELSVMDGQPVLKVEQLCFLSNIVLYDMFKSWELAAH